MLQSQLAILCYQVAGLREGSALSSPTKCMLSYYKSNVIKHVYLDPKPILDIWRCDEQTSISLKLTCVQENITNPLWHVLSPGGRIMWRKCPVSSSKSNINKHVYLNPQPIVEFGRCDERDFKVAKNILCATKYRKASLVCFATRRYDCV